MVFDQSSEAMEYRVHEIIMLRMLFSSAFFGAGLVLLVVEDCSLVSSSLGGSDWSFDSEDKEDGFGRGHIQNV